MHWLGRHRRLALALICALCTGAIIAAAMFREVMFANSIWANETGFRDALERKARRTKVHDEFVFLGIDEASKQLDQVSPEEIAGSSGLQKMKQGYPWSRAVYGELVDRLCDAGAHIETGANPVTGDFNVIFVPPNPALIPGGLEDDRVGYVSIWPDPDTVVRRINYA